MAKTLPPYGDQYLGDNPWAVRSDEVIMYLSGRNTSDVLYGTDVDSDDIAVTASSAAQTVNLWTMPAGSVVYALYANTADSWGTNSDDGNITIGDTVAVDTFFTDTLLAPCATDAPDILKTNALTPPAGKFYNAQTVIAATFPLAHSGVTTGLTKFVLVWGMAR